MTITFDSVDITTNPYVPRFIKHETVPEELLSLMELAREDGSIIIADKYGVKHITLQGVIYGSTQADLETKIDTFKEVFSRKAKNLDVDWAGGTRRYVATCMSHKFNRDYFNISMCPWTADFIVPEGVGKDTSLTATIDALDIYNIAKDQEYATGYDSDSGFGIGMFRCQSFTTGAGIINIKEFDFYMRRKSAYSVGWANVYCDIYAADGNHKPTGASMGQAILLPADFSETSYAWKGLIFSSPITLVAATEYVAVISSPAAANTDQYQIALNLGGGTYAGGQYGYSPDSGANWTSTSTYDYYFRTYYQTPLPYTGSVTFEGSAEPKPVILISVTSGWTNARGFSFENTDTGEKLVILTGGTSVGAGDKFEIDCENKTARWYHGGWINMAFRGVFPHFTIGVNNYEIRAGDIIDQQYTEAISAIALAIYTGQTGYQSFTIPQSDGTYQGITLKLKKTALAPANDLIITILEDSDGVPDAGSPVANATFTIVAGDVTTSLSWIFKNATTAFSLDADKTYWIRVAMAAGDSSHCYFWEYDQNGTYPRGSAYANAGFDFLFKLHYAGESDSAPVQILDIDYYKRYL